MSNASSDLPTTQAEREHARTRIMIWYGVMVHTAEHLPPDARIDLGEWDDHGGHRTSDWPRWSEFIDMDLFWPWPWPQGSDDHAPPTRAARRVPPAPPAGFYLYRLWAADDRLLYVGVTTRPTARMRSHRRRWGDLIGSVTWEAHPNAEAMLAAERAAIREEDPALNKAHVG